MGRDQTSVSTARGACETPPETASPLPSSPRNGWKKVWESLTEFQRETLRLHFYEGCTFTEIAEKFGQSYVNIRHHYYRGLEKFRKHAEENGLNWP
jgi:DNA-directed RNA polymerase specialized sigma24 family protein